MNWVVNFISDYMKRYEVSYEEAIEMMVDELEKVGNDKEQKAFSEEDARD